MTRSLALVVQEDDIPFFELALRSWIADLEVPTSDRDLNRKRAKLRKRVEAVLDRLFEAQIAAIAKEASHPKPI